MRTHTTALSERRSVPATAHEISLIPMARIGKEWTPYADEWWDFGANPSWQTFHDFIVAYVEK